VLSIALSAICGGQTLDDMELLRTDRVLLDALGASSIPDLTTAGDFCRRFRSARERPGYDYSTIKSRSSTPYVMHCPGRCVHFCASDDPLFLVGPVGHKRLPDTRRFTFQTISVRAA
jgi:hypothetical protein